MADSDEDEESDSGQREGVDLSDNFASDVSDMEDITCSTKKFIKFVKPGKEHQTKKTRTGRPRVEIEYETEDLPRERLRA